MEIIKIINEIKNKKNENTEDLALADKEKKIKIELTLSELQIIINYIGAWKYFDLVPEPLLKKLEKELKNEK